MDDLDRLYRLLVRNARTAGPDYLARPFELAELYQTLIPYRHYRRELGIETSEDYELALMRLIAGERGYLVAEPEVQQALMRELGSPNPEPSAFRQYAHAQVAFQPEAVRAMSQGDGASAYRVPAAAAAATASSFAGVRFPLPGRPSVQDPNDPRDRHRHRLRLRLEGCAQAQAARRRAPREPRRRQEPRRVRH